MHRYSGGRVSVSSVYNRACSLWDRIGETASYNEIVVTKLRIGGCVSVSSVNNRDVHFTESHLIDARRKNQLVSSDKALY